jgi:hypothetical protein
VSNAWVETFNPHSDAFIARRMLESGSVSFQVVSRNQISERVRENLLGLSDFELDCLKLLFCVQNSDILLRYCFDTGL